jgi:hypothetical protein
MPRMSPCRPYCLSVRVHSQGLQTLDLLTTAREKYRGENIAQKEISMSRHIAHFSQSQ